MPKIGTWDDTRSYLMVDADWDARYRKVRLFVSSERACTSVELPLKLARKLEDAIAAACMEGQADTRHERKGETP